MPIFDFSDDAVISVPPVALLVLPKGYLGVARFSTSRGMVFGLRFTRCREEAACDVPELSTNQATVFDCRMNRDERDSFTELMRMPDREPSRTVLPYPVPPVPTRMVRVAALHARPVTYLAALCPFPSLHTG